MHKLTVILLLLASLVCAIKADCSNRKPGTLKTFEINLDLEPSLRFQETAVAYKDGIIALVKSVTDLIDPEAVQIIEQIAANIDKYLEYPFNEELKGIANATGLSLGDIVVSNLIYDITAFCTSIVAVRADGTIIHGRNLDYNFKQFMTNITFMARYTRGGQLLFTSAQNAGYVGILSGHKKNAFTFTIDERDQGHWWMNFLVGILDKKAVPLSFLSRSVLENATDFDTALQMLTTTDMIAPCYFIVGGVKPYEGAVITRNQLQVIDVWKLDPSSKGIESWYLLETNYDHWVPPPSSDDRRTPGMKAMNATGQANINAETLLDVLSIPPVCNSGTVYSIYMSAAEDESTIQVLVQYV